jgi:hypothetical protein
VKRPSLRLSCPIRLPRHRFALRHLFDAATGKVTSHVKGPRTYQRAIARADFHPSLSSFEHRGWVGGDAMSWEGYMTISTVLGIWILYL